MNYECLSVRKHPRFLFRSPLLEPWNPWLHDGMWNLCTQSPSLLIKIHSWEFRLNVNVSQGQPSQKTRRKQENSISEKHSTKNLIRQPVQRARKFSAVWGTSSPYSPITILPATFPTGFPMLISKYTFWVTFDCKDASWNSYK